MPLLLLIPLLFVGVVLLWLVLLPFGLWARYRNGGARRRAVGWVVRANAGLAAVSVLLFLLSAWIANRWVGASLLDGTVGLLAGFAVGALALRLTRFEPDATGFHYTPHRGVALLLTALIALRIVGGLWLSARGMGELVGVANAASAEPDASSAAAAWLQGGGWFGVGGLLLGYHATYARGLRQRLRGV